MSDQRYTEALLANGRLREERDRLREALTLVGYPSAIGQLVAERDRLREALTAIVESAEMEYFGAYGVEPELIEAARAALAKEEEEK